MDGKPSRICATSFIKVSVRSSRDVDVAKTEVLLSLLESAIWIRFNLCMSKIIEEAR